MNKILALITLVLLLGLNACGGNTGNTNEPEAEIDLSKVISISSLVDDSDKEANVLMKREAIICDKVTENVDSDIGCIYKSREYQYILTNNSEYELTDVVISSSNPAFEVTPKQIKSIGVPNVKTVPTQLMTVGINHKTPLYTLSESSTLPYGENSTTITVKGFVNGEEFTTTYTVGGFAYSMKATYVVEDSILVYNNSKSITIGCAYAGTEPDSVVIGLATGDGEYINEVKQKIVDGVVKYCRPAVRIDGAPLYVNDKIVNEVYVKYHPLVGSINNFIMGLDVSFIAPFTDDNVMYLDVKNGNFIGYLTDSTGHIEFSTFDPTNSYH